MHIAQTEYIYMHCFKVAFCKCFGSTTIIFVENPSLHCENKKSNYKQYKYIVLTYDKMTKTMSQISFKA